MFRGERLGPLGDESRQLPGLLVVSRPLNGLPPSREVRVTLGTGPRTQSLFQLLQFLGRLLAAGNARRPEEDDGVLYVFVLEAAKRFEILRKDAQRARFLAVEKFLVGVSERLRMHTCII